MVKEIIEKYTTTNISVESLAKEYKVGKLKIKKILNDGGISIRPKGGISKNRPSVEFTMNLENKSIKCKKCGFISTDPENKSGVAIRHIQECFPDIEIPSKLKRANYKKENGLYWHFQYFDVVESDHIETIKCPECDWTSPDLTNKTGALTKHVEKEHGSVEDFIKRNPKYKELFNVVILNEKRKELFNESKDNYVICKLCGKKFKILTQSHLKKYHNITPREYKLKFPLEKIISKPYIEIYYKSGINANKNKKTTYSSKGEISVKEYIKSLGFKAEKGVNGKIMDNNEIDIIIPSINVGFEYDGLLFHSEKWGKTPNYHLDKTINAHKEGYKLYHIFEDEWETKSDIVKEKIKHILGVSDGIKVGARKLKIKKINSNVKSEFLNQNHIQGTDRSKYHYGAYYNDELIGVMTFIEKRNMTKTIDGQYELSRYATKIGYIIPGLGSKFLNHFIKEINPDSVISFADRRWTLDHENNLYTKMGFKLIKIDDPDYYYYNSSINRFKRYHKFGFGKNNLKKKYPYLDFSKSENDLLIELGFTRIWDCGLFKYELKIKKGQ